MRISLDEKISAEDLFGELGKEERQELGEFEIVKTPALEEMIFRFEKLNSIYVSGNVEGNLVNQICRVLTPRDYTAQDITAFSLLIGKDEKEEYYWSDYYLNALIYNCKDKEITIVTQHFDYDLLSISPASDKKVKILGNAGEAIGELMECGLIDISGNVGSDLGYYMKGGEIIVRGNAESLGQKMVGGKITVYGNVGDVIGEYMKGGEIIVRGNAESYLALYATGGTIYVEGEIKNPLESIREESPGVNIFHKGKQIVKEGRILDDRYKS